MRRHPSPLLLPLLIIGLGGLACGDDASPGRNTAPTLTGPTVPTAAVLSGAPVALTLEASDADGDALTYAWTQSPASPAGTFDDASASNPTWTAPLVDGSQRFTLKVTVSDGRGGTEQGAVDVDVASPFPDNHPPTLPAPTATPSTPIDEQQSLALSASASDPDNDTLTYAWEQVSPAAPRGAFNAPASRQPTWTAPDVTASGTYTLRVTVTDGKGGRAQGTVDVAVRKVNQAPTVAATVSAPKTLLAGATGTFTITASDPDGDPLTYTWTQAAPASPGTWVGGTSGASAQWYSPAVGTQTAFTFSVSVTDGASMPVVRTVTVPVSVPRYTADIQNVWKSVPSCLGCHDASGGLNLTAGSSYSSLVNVTSTANGCTSLKLVAPGDPEQSALVKKLEGTACGTRMPRNNQTYFNQHPDQLILVRSWILAGAAND